MGYDQPPSSRITGYLLFYQLTCVGHNLPACSALHTHYASQLSVFGFLASVWCLVAGFCTVIDGRSARNAARTCFSFIRASSAISSGLFAMIQTRHPSARTGACRLACLNHLPNSFPIVAAVTCLFGSGPRLKIAAASSEVKNLRGGVG